MTDLNTRVEWAEYERRNKRANDAYRRRGCPHCGDLHGNMPEATGRVCPQCKRERVDLNEVSA